MLGPKWLQSARADALLTVAVSEKFLVLVVYQCDTSNTVYIGASTISNYLFVYISMNLFLTISQSLFFSSISYTVFFITLPYSLSSIDSYFLLHQPPDTRLLVTHFVTQFLLYSTMLSSSHVHQVPLFS